MNRKRLIEYIFITLGVFFVAVGAHFFFSPNDLVSGGVIGISILLKNLISESLFILIGNGVLLVVGGLVLGKSFFIKTTYATLVMPLFKYVLELIVPSQEVSQLMNLGTHDLFLSSVFGGALIGIGLAIVIRHNATTGGIDVLQQIASKYFKVPFSVALVVIDGLIILAGFISNGILLGLYGILSVIVTAFVLEYLLVSGKAGYTVFIVTNEYEVLKQSIYERIDRGLTKVNVIGGYTNEEKSMIICTISSRELYEFKKIIETNDPKAFTFITKTYRAVGEGFHSSKDSFV